MKRLTEILDTIKLSETSEQLPYSILPMMYGRISSKELLHSQIIASLLDPKERHNLGDLPLSCFLKQLGCTNFAQDLYQTTVEVERGVDDMRRIDILLTNGDSAIIIENKLNDACDQPDQLKDYLKSITKREYKNIVIVYLPLYAYKSAKEEVATTVINLYPADLIEWLTACNAPVCNSYVDLLKYMNQSNRNFMEAKGILANLDAQQIEKLVAVATIVNSADWAIARFDPIQSGVEKQLEHLVVDYKKSNNRCVQLWLPDWRFWVEVWICPSSYDLYAYEDKGDQTVQQELIQVGLKNTEAHYYWKEKTYSFPSKDSNNELIQDIVDLLKISTKR